VVFLFLVRSLEFFFFSAVVVSMGCCWCRSFFPLWCFIGTDVVPNRPLLVVSPLGILPCGSFAQGATGDLFRGFACFQELVSPSGLGVGPGCCFCCFSFPSRFSPRSFFTQLSNTNRLGLAPAFGTFFTGFGGRWIVLTPRSFLVPHTRVLLDVGRPPF